MGVRDMAKTGHDHQEGSLKAPERHPLNWKSPEFHDEDALFAELERVYDICHGCRRCFNLCHAFPTLFDLVDESATMEVDGVAKEDYWKVVDHCYLCDMCFMTKCPYVPPHEWNVDFPHLMLRAKAVKHRREGAGIRNTILSSTDSVGTFAARPLVAPVANVANASRPVRAVLESTLGVHREARIPPYASQTLRSRLRARPPVDREPVATPETRGRVVLFATCYANYNEPDVGTRHRVRVRAQRDRGDHRPARAVLRHAQARARRPRRRRAFEGRQHPGAGAPGRRRLGHRRARAFVRAHVQAGAAAPFPRRSRRRKGSSRVIRSVRIPDVSPSRRRAGYRVQEAAGSNRVSRRLPPAGCRTSG